MIVGLTGAVGAGKSTLAGLLVARGFGVLDVDVVAADAARSLGLAPAAVLAELLTDGPRRAEFETMLIPEVKRRVHAWCEAALGGPAVIDSALLFEHGLDALCSVTICLRCPADERRARVGRRQTTSAKHFDRIEASQLSEPNKAARATHVVWTNQPLEEVARQLAAALGLAA